jgi:hyperosmotically inducible protein
MKSKSIPFLSALIVAVAVAGCASTQTAGRQIDDAEITASVKAKLAADPEVKAHEIDVDTIDGEVRLSGIVDDSAARTEAEKLARRTDGVQRVKNELRVGGDLSTGQEITDATITAEIKSALIADEVVKARDIDVDTLDGVVTLSGIVASHSERRQAEALARECEGVRSVRNQLEVRS